MQTQNENRDQQEKSFRERPQLAPKRVAVIARDFQAQAGTGIGRFHDPDMGVAPHFKSIICAASDHRADTVLFSLWTHNATKFGELSATELFPKDTHHSTVVLGASFVMMRTVARIKKL